MNTFIIAAIVILASGFAIYSKLDSQAGDIAKQENRLKLTKDQITAATPGYDATKARFAQSKTEYDEFLAKTPAKELEAAMSDHKRRMEEAKKAFEDETAKPETDPQPPEATLKLIAGYETDLAATEAALEKAKTYAERLKKHRAIEEAAQKALQKALAPKK